MNTYIHASYRHSHICLPANIHKYITYIHIPFQYFQISLFLEFPYIYTSGNMEIWKFQKYRNPKENEIIYVYRQAVMYIYIYVDPL